MVPWDPTHVSNRLYLSRFTNNGAITYNKIANLYSLIYLIQSSYFKCSTLHKLHSNYATNQEIYFLTFKSKNYSASFVLLLYVYYLPRKTRRQLLLWLFLVERRRFSMLGFVFVLWDAKVHSAGYYCVSCRAIWFEGVFYALVAILYCAHRVLETNKQQQEHRTTKKFP